jgi:hypothetical protein
METRNTASLPVCDTSRSIISLIRANSEARVSKIFSKTEIIISTSEGGHISHIVKARTICGHLNGYSMTKVIEEPTSDPFTSYPRGKSSQQPR